MAARGDSMKRYHHPTLNAVEPQIRMSGKEIICLPFLKHIAV